MGLWNTFEELMRGLDSISESLGNGIVKGASHWIYDDENEILRRERELFKKEMKTKLINRNFQTIFIFDGAGKKYDADVYEVDVLGIAYYNEEAANIKAEIMKEAFPENSTYDYDTGFILDEDGHGYSSLSHYKDSSDNIRYKGL